MSFDQVHGRRPLTETWDVKLGEEVEKTLLPRAELKIAAEVGTVEAIDELKKKYPETAIDKEIEHARKVAIVRAFEKARDEKSLAAMK